MGVFVFLFLLYNPENEALCCDRGSRVVQRKIPGPTTEKPVDGNHLLLKPCLFLQRLPPFFFFSLSLCANSHRAFELSGCTESQLSGSNSIQSLTAQTSWLRQEPVSWQRAAMQADGGPWPRLGRSVSDISCSDHLLFTPLVRMDPLP